MPVVEKNFFWPRIKPSLTEGPYLTRSETTCCILMEIDVPPQHSILTGLLGVYVLRPKILFFCRVHIGIHIQRTERRRPWGTHTHIRSVSLVIIAPIKARPHDGQDLVGVAPLPLGEEPFRPLKKDLFRYLLYQTMTFSKKQRVTIATIKSTRRRIVSSIKHFEG